MGLTNYYSCCVPNYSTFAAPLMSKLQVGRVDGKKGSVKPVEWDEDSRLAFENLKKGLANGLEVFALNPTNTLSFAPMPVTLPGAQS